jgi:hypothetical protein
MMADYALRTGSVIREADGVTIPADDRNRDWRKYLAWFESGGIPDPEVVTSPPSPPIEDRVESGIAGSLVLGALIRRTARYEGITERALLDEIRAEAKEVARQ